MVDKLVFIGEFTINEFTINAVVGRGLAPAVAKDLKTTQADSRGRLSLQLVQCGFPYRKMIFDRYIRRDRRPLSRARL